MADDSKEDEDYHVPLQHRRAFGGAGIKRKRINFVPASDPSVLAADEPPANSSRSVGDVYLSIVLGKSGSTNPPSALSEAAQTNSDVDAELDNHSALESGSGEETTVLCPVCKIPLPASSDSISSMPHEAKLAHQIHLSHAHPPSALDRRSKGFTYLSSRGWDPDSLTGLGASGREGRLYPVKASVREDKRGVGATAAMVQEAKQKEKAAEKLDAKKVRKREQEQKQKQKHISDLVYGRDDVNKYLGIGF